MILTVDEALTRVVVRLEPLFEAPSAPFGLSCSGTDVPGAEIQQRFVLDLQQFDAELARRGPAAGEQLFIGMLAREFWLGYEFGREAER